MSLLDPMEVLVAWTFEGGIEISEVLLKKIINFVSKMNKSFMGLSK